MKRLIDEEDAIRAVCKNCYAEDGGDYKDCRYYPCDDVQAIEALPSTDLERIKAIMKEANEKDKAEHIGRPTDLISRADAIAFINSGISLDTDADREYATEMLKDIPSAEAPKPTGDLVSREDAIEAVAQQWLLEASAESPYVSDDDIGDYRKLASELLSDIPSAEAVQEWIPCSERLPKELEAVNVTWVNHNPPVYYQHIKDVPKADTAVHYRGTWYWWDATVIDLLGEYGGAYIHGIEPIDKDIEVTAWMPLPTPYKGGDTE